MTQATIRRHESKPDTFIVDPSYFDEPGAGLPPDIPVDSTRTLQGWVTDDEEHTITLLYAD